MEQQPATTTDTTTAPQAGAPAAGRESTLSRGLRLAGYAAQAAALQPGVVGTGGRLASMGLGAANYLLHRNDGADNTQTNASGDGAGAAGAGTEAATDTQETPQVRVEITASSLNVRSSTAVTTDNKVGRLRRGDVVAVVADAGEWLQIEFDGQTAYISAAYTRPAPVARPVVETTGEMDTDASNSRYGAMVDAIVSDYRAVPVWAKDQSEGEPAAATFRTPYVLNSGEPAQTGLAAQKSTHGGLSARGGGTVRSAVGGRPFIGKGTPSEVQIVAQAAIDANLTTPAGIQAYINDGPMNSNGHRQNGRWGVDCSGLTAIVVSEMAGTGRDVSGNISAKSYRPTGSAIASRGFTQVAGDSAQAGDVVSYMSTNHVVVIAERQDLMIYNAAGETKRAVKLRVGESSSSGIRATNTFWFVPGAERYGNTQPRTSPDVTLARKNATTPPTWEAYRDGFKVLTSGYSVGNYSIVRPPNNAALRTTPDEAAQTQDSAGGQAAGAQ